MGYDFYPNMNRGVFLIRFKVSQGEEWECQVKRWSGNRKSQILHRSKRKWACGYITTILKKRGNGELYGSDCDIRWVGGLHFLKIESNFQSKLIKRLMIWVQGSHFFEAWSCCNNQLKENLMEGETKYCLWQQIKWRRIMWNLLTKRE